MIYMGHLYIWAMVVVIQIFMAKELFNLLRRATEDRRLPGFRLLNWCETLFLDGLLSLCAILLLIGSLVLVGFFRRCAFVLGLKGCDGVVVFPCFCNILQCFRHFFFTAMLFVYGRILSQRLVNTVASDKVLYKLVSRFIKYHMFTCYFLYIAGLYKGWVRPRLFCFSHIF